MEPTALQAVELMIGFSEIGLSGDTWSISKQSVYDAIYELKPKYPDLFSDIFFSNHTLRPYSTSIESALSTLMTVGLMYMDSPKFKNIFVGKKAKDDFIPYLSSCVSKDIFLLGKEAAKDFDKIILKISSENNICGIIEKENNCHK